MTTDVLRWRPQMTTDVLRWRPQMTTDVLRWWAADDHRCTQMVGRR
jgi:hypothetical protein